MPEEPDTMEPNTEEQLAHYQRRVSELEAEIAARNRGTNKMVHAVRGLLNNCVVQIKSHFSYSEKRYTNTLAEFLESNGEYKPEEDAGQIKLLLNELASLRSQIVEWKPGGSKGGDRKELKPGRYVIFFNVDTRPRIEGVCVERSDDGQPLFWLLNCPTPMRWNDVDYFCLLADIPLPQPPVTER